MFNFLNFFHCFCCIKEPQLKKKLMFRQKSNKISNIFAPRTTVLLIGSASATLLNRVKKSNCLVVAKA